MPDGDIFIKSVSRPWVEPSRIAFGKNDYETAADAAATVLSRELSGQECVEIRSAILTITQAVDANLDLLSRREVVRNLDRFAETLPPLQLEALQQVAQRVLFGAPATIALSISRGIDEETAIRIGAEFLSKLTIMNTAPASKAARMAQAGKMDVIEFTNRTEQFGEHLQSNSNIQNLASQITRMPAGLSEPKSLFRVRHSRISQHDLLKEAIG